MNPMQALRVWWDGPVDPAREAMPGYHLVFVYGTLKRGHGNNRLLTESHFIGTGQTAESLFLAQCGLPYAFRHTPNPMRMHPVAGELYAVNDATLRRLDQLEGHPYGYRREPMDVLVGGERYAAAIYIYQHPGTRDCPAPVNEDGCYEWGGFRR